MKIICDDKIPFLKGTLEPYATVAYYPGGEITKEIVADADAIITRTRTKCNQALLQDSNVKIITTATIGYDHIDTRWVEANGIKWTNAPGCNSGSVKQYIAAALSELIARKGITLEGKTMGIVGVGNVGSKVAQVAESFGMSVLLNDPPRMRNEGGNFVTINTIVEKSDFITFHVPLNREGVDKTFHLLNNELVAKMKPGVVIFNSSRGEVTETAALKRGLDKGIISEAIIDVWENEPKIDAELLGKAFISTPHIAGYSQDGKANGTSMSVQALSRQFGLPLTNWFPDDVPMPKEPIIKLDCNRLSAEKAMAEIILHTYPINSDDELLKSEPQTFEKQRGNYPARREFGVYSVLLTNAPKILTDRLKQIGFGKVDLE